MGDYFSTIPNSNSNYQAPITKPKLQTEKLTMIEQKVAKIVVPFYPGLVIGFWSWEFARRAWGLGLAGKIC
jgi:hypothetical protein